MGNIYRGNPSLKIVTGPTLDSARNNFISEVSEEVEIIEINKISPPETGTLSHQSYDSCSDWDCELILREELGKQHVFQNRHVVKYGTKLPVFGRDVRLTRNIYNIDWALPALFEVKYWQNSVLSNSTENLKNIVSELRNQIQEGTEDVREKAIRTLGDIGTEEAQQILFEALGNDRIDSSHGVIVSSLSRFEPSMAQSALLKCLAYDDWFVQGMAANTISDMKPRDNILTQALVVLIRKYAGLKQKIPNNLPAGIYSGEAFAALINNRSSQERFVIISIIEALGSLREPAAVKPLSKIVRRKGREHTDVVFNAKKALKKIKLHR